MNLYQLTALGWRMRSNAHLGGHFLRAKQRAASLKNEEPGFFILVKGCSLSDSEKIAKPKKHAKRLEIVLLNL